MSDIVLPLFVQLPLSAFSGCLAWLPTHPWELAKNRVILSSDRSVTTLSTFRSLYDSGSLFAGLSAGVSRQVVYTSFRLALYEPIRGVSVATREQFAQGQPTKGVTPFDRIVAGSTAGVVASALSSPVEVALVVQSQGTSNLSLPGAIRKIVSERGVLGLWSGGVPLMTRAAIVGVSQVSFNDQCKTWLRAYAGASQWQPNVLSITAGVLTGIFYAFVTMPVELVRVKMSSGQVAKVGVASALKTFIKQHGVAAVYAPFFPYVTRCVIHTAATFVILDALKRQSIAMLYADRETKTPSH